ncbi:MAG: hypothetical protein KC636_18310, partial [Myxococcales bacterium]|nr:hypothetical protein [Myxococcales bacterium]
LLATLRDAALRALIREETLADAIKLHDLADEATSARGSAVVAMLTEDPQSSHDTIDDVGVHMRLAPSLSAV